MTSAARHELENRELLAQLSTRSRSVFALLCATRLRPAYERFHSRTGRGDPEAVDCAAERLWRNLNDDEPDVHDLEEALERCMAAIPTEEDGWDEYTQPYAEDAAAIVAYAIRARLTGDVQEAVWAGRRAYEAADHFANRGRDAAAETDDHEVVQTEFARQRRDLEELVELERRGKNIVGILAELKQRAEADAQAFFSPR